MTVEFLTFVSLGKGSFHFAGEVKDLPDDEAQAFIDQGIALPACRPALETTAEHRPRLETTDLRF